MLEYDVFFFKEQGRIQCKQELNHSFEKVFSLNFNSAILSFLVDLRAKRNSIEIFLIH